MVVDSTTERPDSDENGVVALLTQKVDQDVTSREEWGSGEKVFIRFFIEDTGRGMTPEETKHLFIRFRQANARTHVDVGCAVRQSVANRLTRIPSRRSTEVQVSIHYCSPLPLFTFTNCST